jgi:hypothetical protein
MVARRLDIAAHHEAGHAVVARMLGVRVKSVTIQSNCLVAFLLLKHQHRLLAGKAP